MPDFSAQMREEPFSVLLASAVAEILRDCEAQQRTPYVNARGLIDVAGETRVALIRISNERSHQCPF